LLKIREFSREGDASFDQVWCGFVEIDSYNFIAFAEGLPTQSSTHPA
jgi:hypothetical protein